MEENPDWLDRVDFLAELEETRRVLQEAALFSTDGERFLCWLDRHGCYDPKRNSEKYGSTMPREIGSVAAVHRLLSEGFTAEKIIREPRTKEILAALLEKGASIEAIVQQRNSVSPKVLRWLLELRREETMRHFSADFLLRSQSYEALIYVPIMRDFGYTIDLAPYLGLKKSKSNTGGYKKMVILPNETLGALFTFGFASPEQVADMVL